jgi:hypothetical protein
MIKCDIMYDEETVEKIFNKFCIDKFIVIDIDDINIIDDDIDIDVNINMCYFKIIHLNLVKLLNKLASQLIFVNHGKLYNSHLLFFELNSSNNELWYGDLVSIEYTPCSQKYIDHYNQQNFIGKLLYLDVNPENNVIVNGFLYDEVNNIIRSIKTEGCHYMGMDDSYIFFIKKISK